jgi:hypothetical protein
MFVLAAAAGLLTACASTAPVYHERSGNDRYGYAEMQLEPNRVRISYNGDTQTPRETVETYLLYRAAETTLQHGYDYFVIAAHDADEDSRFQGMGRPRFGGVNVREISSHSAMADIVMFEGRRPALPNAYDAHAIQQSLAPRINQRPAAN